MRFITGGFIAQILRGRGLRIYNIRKNITQNIIIPESLYLEGAGTCSVEDIIYAAGNNKEEKHLLALHCPTGKLRYLPEMSSGRFSFPLIFVRGFLYAIGGGMSQNIHIPGSNTQSNIKSNINIKPIRMGNCEKYNIKTQKWIPLPSLNIPRQQHTGAYCSSTNSIYIFGGFTKGWNTTAKIEKLNIEEENNWEIISLNMKEGWHPLAHHISTPISYNKIIIYGGCAQNYIFDALTHSIYIQNVESLADCNKCALSQVSKANLENDVVSPVLFRGCVYCFSGRKDIVLRYSIKEDKWTQIEVKPWETRGGACVIF